MSDISLRLDKLKKLIQTEDFLFGRGLSNEVNIRIFCYAPSEEMTIKYFVDTLLQDRTIVCNIHHYDLYKVFLEICDDKKIISSIPSVEYKRGTRFLLKQLISIAPNTAFVNKMLFSPQEIGKDLILLSGVGDVFPFIRVHNLLEAMQPHFSIPILVLYPGKYEDAQLQLFGKLPPNSYYRAFNIV